MEYEIREDDLLFDRKTGNPSMDRRRRKAPCENAPRPFLLRGQKGENIPEEDDQQS